MFTFSSFSIQSLFLLHFVTIVQHIPWCAIPMWDDAKIQFVCEDKRNKIHRKCTVSAAVLSVLTASVESRDTTRGIGMMMHVYLIFISMLCTLFKWWWWWLPTNALRCMTVYALNKQNLMSLFFEYICTMIVWLYLLFHNVDDEEKPQKGNLMVNEILVGESHSNAKYL